jgi:hypothetical protein
MSAALAALVIFVYRPVLAVLAYALIGVVVTAVESLDAELKAGARNLGQAFHRGYVESFWSMVDCLGESIGRVLAIPITLVTFVLLQVVIWPLACRDRRARKETDRCGR